MLETFNGYVGGRRRNASQAAAFVARIAIMPLPESLSLGDWRSHVPMHLLETWDTLLPTEQMALFVMAQSATHSYECTMGPELPALN
ncbi:MAG TPA: hypothetical protein VG326_03445 [Tepidisphaeraceae bacterium]|jgi:hypothetical protein|nr:hypothetical protein [Tepidisphaeraceae bacterium]